MVWLIEEKNRMLLRAMNEDTWILILPLNVFTEWLHPLEWSQSVPGAGGSLGVQIPGVCGLLKGLL